MEPLEHMLFDEQELGMLRNIYEDICDDEDEEIPKYSRKNNICSWAFYEKHHLGKNSAIIFREDPNLAHFLKKDGQLIKIQDEQAKYKNRPLMQYWDMYSDCDRNELREKNPNLYRRMSSKGQLMFVPKPKRKNSKVNYGKCALRYYWEECFGMTKGRLSTDFKAVYTKLYKNEKLRFVPTKRGLADFMQHYDNLCDKGILKPVSVNK